MLRGEGVLEELRALLREGGGEEVEVLYMRERRGMSRFYRSNPHQGGEVADITLFLRTLLPGRGGSRVGVVSLHSLRRESLRSSLERSRALADAGEPVPDLSGLPSPQDAGSSLEGAPLEELYDEETALFGPEERALVLSEVFAKAEARGQRASGCLTTSQGEMALVNSLGLERYAPFSLADLSLIMEAGDRSSSGFACACSRKVKDIDFEQCTARALEKCALGREPRALEPGSYRVILEPPAVAELLIWLALTGFGAKAYLEGRAFSSGRLGERVTGERVPIRDDALEPRCL
ncbi:MAG: metallopeptidase TldD-related protein, partial [Nitrospinota bacterium]